MKMIKTLQCRSATGPSADLQVNFASLVFLCGLIVSAGPTACAAMPADAQDLRNVESVRVGRTVAGRVCAHCHSVGASGESLNPKAPTFREIVAHHGVDTLPGALFLDGTVLRHPGMAQFDLEVDGLIADIRSLGRQ